MMNEIIYIRICHISTYTFCLSPSESVEEADIVTEATDNVDAYIDAWCNRVT